METVLWTQWNSSHRPQMHRKSITRNPFKVSATPILDLNQNRKRLFINALIPCSGTQGTPKRPNTFRNRFTQIDKKINTLMFVTWLKPSRGKHSTAPAKQLLGATYYAKEIKLHELLIIDQLAKNPLCSLNRDLRPIRC